MSATEITTFERDGREWIRFRLGLTREDVAVQAARDAWFELPVRRYVRIVQATGVERRPVISLPMTLGPIEQQVEFTVNDRTRLTHPVLLGRRFMMDLVLVDVSR
ncbi:RimK/LysX family protein, partial [Arthrospira platensis SPKY2]